MRVHWVRLRSYKVSFKMSGSTISSLENIPLPTMVWHYRLGHPSENFVDILVKKELLKLYAEESKQPDANNCNACLEGKITLRHFGEVHNRNTNAKLEGEIQRSVPIVWTHSYVWLFGLCSCTEGKTQEVGFCFLSMCLCWIYGYGQGVSIYWYKNHWDRRQCLSYIPWRPGVLHPEWCLGGYQYGI